MIDRRRIPSPAGPSTTARWSSGPRCTSVAFIRSSASRSGLDAPSSSTMPQMPHTSGGGLRRERVAHRSPDRLDQHAEVQVYRAVGDELEVVRELLGPRVLAREAHLGEA